jgi:hypothetical protein
MFDLLAQAVDWGDLIQPLLETVLNIVLPIVLSAAALWIKQLISKAKAEIEEANLSWLLVLAQQLVVAAEQAGVTGMIEDIGEEKKAMVIGLLQKAADERGIKVDVEVISAIIEAAVVDAFGLSEPESPPSG